jgi:glycosyltransferase involved in cell wall biosynthesis
MLIDKGICEFVEAARSLKECAEDWQFVLAGVAGYGNPTAISVEQLKAWEAEGCVRWLGHVEDMVPLYRDAAIVCLPSYREGMPKSLLEAAAAGSAVVTTDVTGCRESIIPNVTGELVPVRDSKSLADALSGLIENKTRRKQFGINGQELAKQRFSLEITVRDTMEIYKELLKNETEVETADTNRT